MCYEVSCHRFLYDYFQKHQTECCVSIRKINDAINIIEHGLNTQIRIDMTRDSLSSVINNSKNIELDNRYIKFKEGFLREEPIKFYEEDLPSDLQKKYSELLEKKS